MENATLLITLQTQVNGSAELTQMLSTLIETKAQDIESVTIADPPQRFGEGIVIKYDA